MKRRKQERENSTHSAPPSVEELRHIHDLFMAHQHPIIRSPAARKSARHNVVFPSDTHHEAARFMHPQYKNVHGKVFGGYATRSGVGTCS